MAKNYKTKKEGFRQSNVGKRKFDSQNKTNERINDGVFIYSGAVNISTLAEKLNLQPAEIMKFLLLQGKIVNINTMLDDELIGLICMNYNYDFKKEEVKEVSDFESLEIEDDVKDLVTRPPIVTIMGHVDHGKTTLLDKIRKSKIVEGEFGGITQAIGAYQIDFKGQKITFLDTPGHEAFAAMRARGADVTDIVVLVVAVDDGVMPQTKEAIDHARFANVPIIVAINKIDKPGVDPEKIMTSLADFELLPEEWGGTTIYRQISAKMGEGIEDLLENIVLIAEMKELKANPKRYAMGRVIEAELDRGLGAVATLIVQNGTLKVGDPIVVGATYGKVRNMFDDMGRQIKFAAPSTAVRITGLADVPAAGDSFMAFAEEKQAKQIASLRKEKKIDAAREGNMIATNIEELLSGQEGIQQTVNIIIKADSQGAAEAVKESVLKIEVPGIKINVIRAQAGAITESDVLLASAGSGLIFGFSVRPDAKVRAKAEEEKVEIRLYRVIYQLVEELEQSLKGLLKPEIKEIITGQAEVRQLFKVSKIGTIAGAFITSGLIKNHSLIRIIRDGIVVYEGKILSLKRFKDEVKEVKLGFDCGIVVENYNDIKENDIIEGYEMVEVK